ETVFRFEAAILVADVRTRRWLAGTRLIIRTLAPGIRNLPPPPTILNRARFEEILGRCGPVLREARLLTVRRV
ncbi:MAG TPA: hypothetical protein VNM37_22010, partial [Candidatus Dormibacteraeota bacterium]|nr:hypothetical protein [Candidatus Dormibacteraeota bacterium]